MNLNFLPTQFTQTHTTTHFQGLGKGEGQFLTMRNMVYAEDGIATRPKYHVLREVNPNTQLFSHNTLLSFQNGTLSTPTQVVGQLTQGQKSYARFANFGIFMPDKMLYNAEFSTLKPMAHTFCASGVKFNMADEFGTPFNYTQSYEPPTEHELWLDLATSTLKRYGNEAWQTVQSPYICLQAKGIGEGFKAGDALSLSGISTYPTLNRSFVVEVAEPNYLTLFGTLPKVFEEPYAMCIEKAVPTLESLCVFKNRLWGFNPKTQELHASKWNDPTVFYAFSGQSTDSFVLQLEEEPLALAPLEDELLIFTINKVLRLTGTRPQNFSTATVPAPTLQWGCQNSLQRVQGAWYYLSTQGVVAYNGLFSILPTPFKADSALGFASGEHYYVSVEGDGLYAFHTLHKVWHKEEQFTVSSAVFHKGTAYMVVENKLLSLGDPKDETALRQSDVAQEEALHWCVQTQHFNLKGKDKLKLTALHFNMKGQGTYAIYVAYDALAMPSDALPWQLVDVGNLKGEFQFNLPLAHDAFSTASIRLCGEGEVKLFALGQTWLKI